MNTITGFLGGMPGANGNPATGLMSLILMIVGGVAGKKSIFWVRPNMRGSMSSKRGMVMDKKTGLVRIFTPNVYIRPPWIYQMEVVPVIVRNDEIKATAMSLATVTERSQKLNVTAMARWKVDDRWVYPYLASAWVVDDVGEFARGAMSKALGRAIEHMPASAITVESLFTEAALPISHKLIEHGAVWLDLFISENAPTDAEVQASAIDRLTTAVHHLLSILKK